MHEWVVVIILGIIEGITEFLPISSTGHLLIAGFWLSPRSDLFNIVIQSGAVIAVLPLFPARLHQFIFRWRERETRIYLSKIAAAFFITAIGGLALNKYGFELPEDLFSVAWALFIGGVAFLLAEKWLKNRSFSTNITWTVVFMVAIGQLLAATFPGTSRSGATILLMLLLGVRRSVAIEFSFLVGIPTMIAAGAFKIYSALIHNGADASKENWGMVALGFMVSALVSFIVVRWLIGYIQNHTFSIFGWYRIVLAILIFYFTLLNF